MNCVAFIVAALIGQDSKLIDWPALIHRPHEKKPPVGPKLPPLIPGGGAATTKQAWDQARQRLQEKWTAILGRPPEAPPQLGAVVHREEKPEGCRRNNVSFISEGDDRVRAALLVPDSLKPNARRAAVVVFHETTPLTFRQPAGLAGPEDRQFGVELVRRGFVVLCPECYILKPPDVGNPGGPINVAKWRAEVIKKRQPGWTGMGKLTFDSSRCVDYLQSLPFVDADRIGCLGFSLGAKQVIYAMAFEPRYKAGVANEGGVGIRMSNWSDEWYLGKSIDDQLQEVDHHQLLALAAPRAILVQGGGSADGDASWPFVAAALPIYGLFGAGDRIGLHHHRGKHTYPEEARRIAYSWLDRWLKRTAD